MNDKRKITEGLNDRPVDTTIAQTGEGLPDDTSRQVEVDPEAVDRMRAKLDELGGDAPEGEAPPPRRPGP